MIEYRFCPQCGETLAGKDLGREGFYPWCAACDQIYIQPAPVQLMALIQDKNNRLLLHNDGHFPLFSVRYHEWLEDSFHRGFSRLLDNSPLYCEYLTSFWDEGSETILAGMYTKCVVTDVTPDGYRWRPTEDLPKRLSETERRLLTLI